MEIDKKFIEYFKNLKQVFIYLTDECNLSCKQCLYKPNLVLKKKISPDTAISLLEICRHLGAFKLTLLGGECTLYDTKSLIKIIQYSKSIGYKYVRIDTNGVFDKRLYKTKLFSMLDEISFSIDGFNDISNDILRGSGSFQQTLSNLRIAVASGHVVHITSCVTKQNTLIAGGVRNYIFSMIKFAEIENVKTINFHGVFKMGTPMDSWTSESHLNPEDWYYSVKEIQKRINNHEFSVKVRLPLHIIKKDEFDSCPEYYGYCPSKLGERVLIHPTGIIRICSSLLSTCYGSAFFNKDRIQWNEYSNELCEIERQIFTPCSHQKALYSNDFVPVCFSLKPYQHEIVWENLKNTNLIKEDHYEKIKY